MFNYELKIKNGCVLGVLFYELKIINVQLSIKN